MKKSISIIFIQFIFAIGVWAQPVTPRALTPEQNGDEAAAAGKYNDAINSYKQQWQSCPAGTGDGNAECETLRDRLTTKMGAALAKLSTPPAVMEDADFHAAKGRAFLKPDSKVPVEKAVKEFQDAVNLAPWLYDLQFNLAIALKSASQFKNALVYCKYARNLAQSDDDRRNTTALRGEIEAASEIAAAASVEAEKSALVAKLREMYTGKDYTLRLFGLKGGTQAEAMSRGVSIGEAEDGKVISWTIDSGYRFEVSNEKIVLKQGQSIKLEGILSKKYPSLDEIVWINKGFTDGKFAGKSGYEIQCFVREEKTELMCTPNGPINHMVALTGYDNDHPFHFIIIRPTY